MSYSTIQTLMFSLVKEVAGSTITLIPRNDNGSRPASLYYVYQFETRLIGTSSVSDPNKTTDVVNLSHSYEIMLAVETYNKGAKAAIFDFCNKLKLEKNQLYFLRQGISYLAGGTVTDLTALQDETYQERARLDIKLRYTEKTTETIKTFDEIQGGFTLNPGGLVVPLDI